MRRKMKKIIAVCMVGIVLISGIPVEILAAGQTGMEQVEDTEVSEMYMEDETASLGETEEAGTEDNGREGTAKSEESVAATEEIQEIETEQEEVSETETEQEEISETETKQEETLEIEIEIEEDTDFYEAGEITYQLGENVKGILSSDGTLTISGEGEMYDYKGDSKSPLEENEAIKKL